LTAAFSFIFQVWGFPDMTIISGQESCDEQDKQTRLSKVTTNQEKGNFDEIICPTVVVAE
jgi:hypothetical protein